jgi:ABC-2 type transport system ATP-binding protein
LPQNFNAFERLTVKENIELIAKISGSKTNINEHLKLLGLWDVKDKKFGTLSGGMKRRVGICMALITDPDILFLDEPTTGLDPQARKEVWTIIKNLRKSGKTIFLTTHYMDEVEILCDRASLIVQGKIIHTASINELISKYGSGIRIIADNKPNSKETPRIH